MWIIIVSGCSLGSPVSPQISCSAWPASKLLFRVTSERREVDPRWILPSFLDKQRCRQENCCRFFFFFWWTPSILRWTRSHNLAGANNLHVPVSRRYHGVRLFLERFWRELRISFRSHKPVSISKTPENGIFAVRMGWYPLTSMIMAVLGVRLDSSKSRSSNVLRF